MSRIFLAILLFSVVIFPVTGQEPGRPDDPQQNQPAQDSLQAQPVQDSLQTRPVPDSPQTRPVPDSPMLTGSADTLALKQPDYSHSPYKAIMYALVLPGLGQVYNHKYYKIPIVYAALGGATYAIVFNTRQYRQSSYEYALSPDETNKRYLEYWRRNMELSYIGLILGYALQVIDAYVDAQLYNWDVNQNLSLRIAPSLQPMMTPASVSGHALGLTCNIDFRRR